MKIIKLFLISLILVGFCACATTQDMKREGKEPLRNYPVFLKDEGSLAAFKIDISAPGIKQSAVLTISKIADNDFKIKMLGDFATVIIEAEFKAGKTNFTYILGNMFDKKALDILNDTFKVLLTQPADFIRVSTGDDGTYQTNYRNGDFINRYHFKKGLSFPFKLEQIKTTVRKKYSFDNYDVYGSVSLPSVITCEDAHNIASLTLTLINIK